MKSEEIEKIKSALKDEKDVLFVYLFGSYARKTTSPLSDIDIAVHLKKGADLSERKIEMLTLISKTIKNDKIDLVILNEASPSIIHSVIKTGILLFSRDEEKRISFITKNLKEFLDMEYHRKKFWEAMKKRIKEGRFGF